MGTNIFQRIAARFIVPIKAAVKNGGAFDIEGNGFLDTVTELHCIAIADLNSDRVDQYGPQQIDAALEHLSRLDYLVVHNGLDYDLRVLHKLKGWAPKAGCTVVDSLIAGRLILPNISDLDDEAAARGDPKLGKLRGRYSIEAWGARLGMPKAGADIEDFSTFTSQMMERCVGDTLICKRLWQFLQPGGYSQYALELEHRVAPLCNEIAATGMYFDIAAAKQRCQEWTARRDELETQLHRQFPDTNLNSRKQIGALLESRGWVPEARTEKTKQPKIDDETLESIAEQYPEFAGLSEHYILGRRLGQLVNGKKAWAKCAGADGRIHGGIVHIGTPHSRAKHLEPNLTQVPNPKRGKPFATECRSLFKAREGWVLVACDQATLQDRGFAHYLAEHDGGAYAKDFLAGLDTHWHTATALGLANHQRNKESKADTIIREGAKTFRYAFLYGAGAARLGLIVANIIRAVHQIDPNSDLPRRFFGGATHPKDTALKRVGRQSLDKFQAATPGLRQLRAKLQAFTERRGWLPGLDGRRIPTRAQYTALNFIVTASEAIICKRWLVRTYDELCAKFRYGWDGDVVICLWVHDEIVACCRPEIAAEVGAIMVRNAKEAGEFYHFKVALDADYTISNNWGGDSATAETPSIAPAATTPKMIRFLEPVRNGKQLPCVMFEFVGETERFWKYRRGDKIQRRAKTYMTNLAWGVAPSMRPFLDKSARCDSDAHFTPCPHCPDYYPAEAEAPPIAAGAAPLAYTGGISQAELDEINAGLVREGIEPLREHGRSNQNANGPDLGNTIRGTDPALQNGGETHLQLHSENSDPLALASAVSGTPETRTGAPRPQGRDDKLGNYTGSVHGNSGPKHGQRIASWIYRHPNQPNYLRVDKYVTRDGDKRFRQHHWNGKRWVYGVKDTYAAIKIPYRLLELLAAPVAEPVWICEGENDADNVAALGLIATTNPGGAKNWQGELAQWFKSKELAYIVEDNDAAGREHTRKIQAALHGIMPRIAVISFPELPDHGDVSDWLEAGGNKKLLLARAQQALKRSRRNDFSLEILLAAKVKIEAIDWLWPGRFALGKLGILAGLPDEGKSSLLCYIAARLTNPKLAWPNDEGCASKHGTVILLTCEDSPADTLVPRLAAADADLDRIKIIQMVHDRDVKDGRERRRMFSLAEDLDLLRREIEQLGDVVALLIDPVTAYLGTGKNGVDSFRDTDVRAVLGPLVQLAVDYRIAIIAIMHFNKKIDVTNALLRISNSLAFGGVARHVFAITKDTANSRRLMSRAKNNIASEENNQTLAFHFATKHVGNDWRDGRPIEAPFITFEPGYVDITATEALSAVSENKTPGVLEDAKDFLRGMLVAAGGRAPKADIEEAADAEKISIATLRRAKTKLKIRAEKDRSDPKGKWYWVLPEDAGEF